MQKLKQHYRKLKNDIYNTINKIYKTLYIIIENNTTKRVNENERHVNNHVNKLKTFEYN